MDSNEVGGSAVGRPGLSEAQRRQLAYFDAQRRGATDLAEKLALADGGGSLWRVRWASSTDLDPRLLREVHAGAVTALAWAVVGGRAVLAAATSENAAAGRASAYELRLWDVESGDSQPLPCTESVRCLAFVSAAGATLLVSGHRQGLVRVWDVRDQTLRGTLDTGGDHLRDLLVAGAGSDAHVVTLDVRGQVQRWSLTTGARLGVVDAPKARSICGGALADGRRVVLTGGDGLALWDLGDGRRLPLPVPQELGRVARAVLSAAGGRDLVTVVDEFQSIRTFDVSTGQWIGPAITAHVEDGSDSLMGTVRDQNQAPQIAVVKGKLAVATRWRVRVWDLETSQALPPPVTGAVAGALVREVQWQGRPMLLTGSSHDGVVGLWDLDRPAVLAPGHGERVARVCLVERADVVVSADEGGTLVAREVAGGRPAAAPLATGVGGLRALAAWQEGGDLVAATGAGRHHARDGSLRWWNLTGGKPFRPPVEAHTAYLHWIARVLLPDGPALVTFGSEGMFKIWRQADGALSAASASGLKSKVSGFVTGVIGGRTVAVLSSTGQPLRVHDLEDLAAEPTVVPEAGHDVVLDMVGSRIITGRVDDPYSGPTTVRVWTAAGERVGAEIGGTAVVVAAAVREWPAVYIARADGTVALTDLETGRDLCPAVLLPAKPTSLAVTRDRELIVGFGSDVARIAPPNT